MATLSMTAATARFECLQGDCPDTCCTGFRVGLSAVEYDRLSALLATHPDTRDRNALVKLKRSHALAPSAPGGDASFAQQDGQCVLLDTDGLCAVHRHFGEPALATVCSLYPRTVAEVEGKRQVFLTLACPEAARLILTEPDAFTPASTTAAQAAVAPERSHPHRTLEEQTFSLLREHHRKIEGLTLALDDAATTLSESLFFLAVFADALCEAQAQGVEAVAATLAQFADDGEATLASLRTAFKNLPPPSADDVVRKTALAADLLAARLGQGPHGRFVDHVTPVLFSGGGAVSPADILRWFENRPAAGRSTEAMVEGVARWQRAHGDVDREQKILRAMVRHSLQTEWWIRATTPQHQVTMLMMRVALVRLLAAFDPRHHDDTKETTFDAVMVDAVQLVAKNISHVPTFSRLAELAFEERGVASLEGSVALLPKS